jgi:hypothetical protein
MGLPPASKHAVAPRSRHADPAQHAAAAAGTGLQKHEEVDEVNPRKPRPHEQLRTTARGDDGMKKWSRGDSNPRAETVSTTHLHVCSSI